MSRIRSAFTTLSHYFTDRPKVMGRWTIVYCPDTIKTTVDRTNEDHCGPCGQYGVQSQTPRVKSPETIVHRKVQ
jgi:hypothetical protein